MKYLVTIAVIFLLASCCKQLTPQTTANTKDSVRTEVKYQLIEKIKDTTIYVGADSSLLVALLECDSTGSARLIQINKLKAGRTARPAAISLNSNQLLVKCNIDSFAVYAQVKDRYQLKDTGSFQNKSAQSVIIKEMPVNYVSGFQWFQIWTGRIFLLLLLLYCGWQLASTKFSILKKLFKWGK